MHTVGLHENDDCHHFVPHNIMLLLMHLLLFLIVAFCYCYKSSERWTAKESEEDMMMI